MQRADLDLTPPRWPSDQVRPPRQALLDAAGVLAAARNPGILVGSRVAEAGAVAELVAVAEQLGAPVIHEASTSHGRCSFPPIIPWPPPPLPFWSPEVRERLAEFDVLLVVGMKLMQQYIYHEPARPHSRARPPGADRRQIPGNWARTIRVEVGLVGHPKAALAELAELLAAQMTPEQTAAARGRAAARGQSHQRATGGLAAPGAKPLRRPAAGPLEPDGKPRPHPARRRGRDRRGPHDDDGLLFRAGRRAAEHRRLFRPARLGLGLGAELRHRRAVGVARSARLGPHRRRLGDVRHSRASGRPPATACRSRSSCATTASTRSSRIVPRCLQLPAACENRFEGLDLDEPSIDYVALSRSLGVSACRVSSPDELSDAVRQSLVGRRAAVGRGCRRRGVADQRAAGSIPAVRLNHRYPHSDSPPAASRTLNSNFQRPGCFVPTHHSSNTPNSVIREWNRTGT